MEELLFGNWDVNGRGHEFRHPQYRQRSKRRCAFRQVASLISPKIFNVLYSNGTCPSITGQDGAVTRLPCPDAYGYVLGTMGSCLYRVKLGSDYLPGTSLVCAFLEIFMSLVPPRVLQRIFPPMVTGIVILIIGASLVGQSGIPNWGGGSNDCRNRPATGFFQLCPNIAAPKPKLYASFQIQPNRPLIIQPCM